MYILFFFEFARRGCVLDSLGTGTEWVQGQGVRHFAGVDAAWEVSRRRSGQQLPRVDVRRVYVPRGERRGGRARLARRGARRSRTRSWQQRHRDRGRTGFEVLRKLDLDTIKRYRKSLF